MTLTKLWLRFYIVIAHQNYIDLLLYPCSPLCGSQAVWNEAQVPLPLMCIWMIRPANNHQKTIAAYHHCFNRNGPVHGMLFIQKLKSLRRLASIARLRATTTLASTEELA
eukprot:scaffold4878_cov236-Alexandrium_tamarense.AAC.1